MADERTLFERILQPEVKAKASRTSRERKEMVVESIIRHLRDLLNTRQGSCETSADYGMPELESKAGSKISLERELESEIRNTIMRYEPRLERVRVRMESSEEDRLVPRFIITGKLTTRDDYTKDVSFSTIVDAIGKMQVK